MIEYLLVSIIFALEMSLVVWFFSRVLNFRRKVCKLHAAIMVFFTTACSIFIYSLNAIFDTIPLPIASIRSFTNLGSVLVVLVILFLGNAREKTTVFLLGILPVISVEILVAYTSGGFYIEPPKYSSWTSFLVYLIGVFFMWLVFQILIRVRWRGSGCEDVFPRYWAFEIAVLGIIFMLSYSIFLFFKKLPNLDFMSLFTLPFFMFSLVVVLEVINYFSRRYYAKENETRLLSMQNDYIEKYILQKLASDEQIRILSHDLRHNLGRFKQLADQSGDERAAEAVAEYDRLLEQCRMPDVGNDIANAIINEKRTLAKRDNIDFTVRGGFNDGLSIEQIDFCSLLGNLLDNALEAAAQVEDEEKRFVKLQINRKNHMLFLSLENSYAHEPEIKNGAFITCKKNRELHGFGTISINNIAEKYNGVVENTYQNNVFSSSVMLRCYD